MKTIKIDFFQPNKPDGKTLDALLEQIHTSPEGEGRNIAFGSNKLRVDTLNGANGIYEGELLFIRMDDVPVKANISGLREPIDLDDDEGIGEEAAFLYHKSTNTLLLQRNRFGASPGAFAKYVQEKNDLEDIFTLDPILKRDAMERLTNMQSIQSFEFGIGGITNLEFFKNLGAGVDKILQLKDEFESPNVSIKLSMGHKKGSLPNSIIETAKSLFRISRSTGSDVRRLTISGRYSVADEDLHGINLLKDRMCEIRNFTTEDRLLSYDVRIKALKEALENTKTELATMFRS